MFKKPPNNWKTSAPLRSSDRRKLKQRVVASFSITGEEADVLVPEGILSVKFSTHLDEQGVAYLAPDGNPLWFTLGKGSEDLIPTVYTLWRNTRLLPSLSTPKAVIPILSGGADLMIPGVVHCSPSLAEGQLVAICKFERAENTAMLSPPLAVGRMAIPSDRLRDNVEAKGKAVYVLHSWKDHLWELGSKGDVPESVSFEAATDSTAAAEGAETDDKADEPAIEEVTEAVNSVEISEFQATQTLAYSADEVSQILRMALLQAIAKTLGSLPPSAFPIPSTIFYTSHILPNRPHFPELVLRPSAALDDYAPSSDTPGPDPYSVTIKTSSHKSLSAYLKVAEKASLISVKAPQKHSAQNDVLITSVNAKHPDVQAHRPFASVREVEEKAAKKTLREEKEKEKQAAADAELEVRELWKPHSASVDLFAGMGGNASTLYTLPEIRTILNAYIASNKLVNPHEQAYINLDPALASCVVSKAKTKSKNKSAAEPEPPVEFMKRDELIRKVIDSMQSWYEIRTEGSEGGPKKGKLSAIQIVTKVRQGRKASTLITGVEPFNIVPEDMAEDLRKLCAGATSVTPVPGKPANSGMEVLVQGKQSKAVVEYLLGKGVPKKWIEVQDLSGKK